jgi:hypothetical protein
MSRARKTHTPFPAAPRQPGFPTTRGGPDAGGSLAEPGEAIGFSWAVWRVLATGSSLNWRLDRQAARHLAIPRRLARCRHAAEHSRASARAVDGSGVRHTLQQRASGSVSASLPANISRAGPGVRDQSQTGQQWFSWGDAVGRPPSPGNQTRHRQVGGGLGCLSGAGRTSVSTTRWPRASNT